MCWVFRTLIPKANRPWLKPQHFSMVQPNSHLFTHTQCTLTTACIHVLHTPTVRSEAWSPRSVRVCGYLATSHIPVADQLSKILFILTFLCRRWIISERWIEHKLYNWKWTFFFSVQGHLPSNVHKMSTYISVSNYVHTFSKSLWIQMLSACVGEVTLGIFHHCFCEKNNVCVCGI